MKELLDNIQILIDENLDKPVTVQRQILEPLFDLVYQKSHDNNNLDIRDMLKLSQLENQLNKRIIDVNPKIEPSSSINSNDKTIEQVVYYSRKKAEDIYHCSIKNDSLKSRSLDFCNIVLEISKNLGISACMFNLGEYFALPIKHYIVITFIEDNYYLIDITYQQFFLLGYNFENRYYEHPSYIKVCDIGGRMINDRKDTAIKVIRDGFIKLKSDFKNYFDAFMEFGNHDKLDLGHDYLKQLLNSLKGSSDKSERLLYSKMNF